MVLMIPLLWRTLIVQYLKVLILSVAAFTAILVLMRLEETARFAALGASWQHILLFNLFEMPHMLPIAIPISCLLSSYLLLQRLSASHELVAMRAAGISLSQIAAPLLLTATLVCCLNFVIASEVTTYTRLESRKMVKSLTSSNPLTLLNNLKFLKQRQIFVQSEKKQGNESASDVVVIVKNDSSHHLSAMIARKLTYRGSDVKSDYSTIISTMKGAQEEGFDHLIVENQRTTITPASEFVQLLRDTGWRLSLDYLRLPLLLARREIEQSALANASEPKERRHQQDQIHHLDNELYRRFALGWSPLPFTLLGFAYGVAIGRGNRKKTVLALCIITALSLTCFIGAKEIGRNDYKATLLFIVPYMLMPLAALSRLQRLAKGIE